MTATVESFIQEYAAGIAIMIRTQSPNSASIPSWRSAAANLFTCLIVTSMITSRRSWRHIEEAEQPPGRP